MSSCYSDVSNVRKSQAHLRNNEWVRRKIKDNFSRLDPLEIYDRSNGEIKIRPPPTDDGISRNRFVAISAKKLFDGLPSGNIIKSAGRRRIA